MKAIVKTFVIKKDEIYPNEINEKLEEYYSTIKNNGCLKGNLYRINEEGVIKGVIRYHMNLFEIVTEDKRKNLQIKSELEKILNIKLVASK
jgi:hypothetical protein